MGESIEDLIVRAYEIANERSVEKPRLVITPHQAEGPDDDDPVWGVGVYDEDEEPIATVISDRGLRQALQELVEMMEG